MIFLLIFGLFFYREGSGLSVTEFNTLSLLTVILGCFTILLVTKASFSYWLLFAVISLISLLTITDDLVYMVKYEEFWSRISWIIVIRLLCLFVGLLGGALINTQRREV